MKFNFKKISAIVTGTLMLGMTLGVASAANYPTPFLETPAIVYGTGSGVSTLDQVYATNVNLDLTARGGTSSGTGSSVSGGDNVLLAKSSDNMNIGNTLSTVWTATINDGHLSTLLADGTYTADDNDEFDYEQTIKIGALQVSHFRDSDYESLVGLDERTPVVGVKLTSSTWVMNYTLDFTTDVESDIVDSDLDDIEGSDMTILGKTYYVSNFDNSTGTQGVELGALTLLDSANEGTVLEGETVTMTTGGLTYEVSMRIKSTTQIYLTINGDETNALGEGDSAGIGGDVYVGVKDIAIRDVTGTVGSATFSIGSGKLKLTSGSDIELNDNTVQGVKAWVYAGTDSAGAEKLSKIEIEWRTDAEEFLSPESELTMPGFEAVKFTMAELVRPTEEKILIEKDGDTSMELNMPIKDGDISINLLYGNASGEFEGIGKSATERLASSPNSTLLFHEKWNGEDFHEYFVASYNVTAEAESYLLRARITYDTSNAREEVDIEKYASGAWTEVCSDKTNASTCDIGDVSFTIDLIKYASGGNESIVIKGGTDVNFNTVYTPGGLRVYLPYGIALPIAAGGYVGTVNVTDATFGLGPAGSINLGIYEYGGNGSAIDRNLNRTSSMAGHSAVSWYLNMSYEDKDDNIAASSKSFYLTVDDDGTNHDLEMTQVEGAGSGGASGLEVGDSTSTYEAYITSDVAPRILHYTKSDDYAEVYYPNAPNGNSETYAEIYLTEAGATISSGTTGTTVAQIGSVVYKDSETSSYADKNVIIVGGSCINSAAAKVLGLSAGTCSAAWTTATGVGAGQYLIQGFASSSVTSKHALLVAGNEVAETQMATEFLTHQTVDTSKKYIGTSATTATVQVEETA